MDNLLDLYKKGDREDYPLVCLDEKLVYLRQDSREVILMSPGNPKK